MSENGQEIRAYPNQAIEFIEIRWEARNLPISVCSLFLLAATIFCRQWSVDREISTILSRRMFHSREAVLYGLININSIILSSQSHFEAVFECAQILSMYGQNAKSKFIAMDAVLGHS